MTKASYSQIKKKLKHDVVAESAAFAILGQVIDRHCPVRVIVVGARSSFSCLPVLLSFLSGTISPSCSSAISRIVLAHDRQSETYLCHGQYINAIF